MLRDQGCQHLCKLESERVELINLMNWSTCIYERMKMERIKLMIGGRVAWSRRPRRYIMIELVSDKDK